MNDNEKTVRQACEAFTSGDMEIVKSIFADDVVVHVPPGFPMAVWRSTWALTGVRSAQSRQTRAPGEEVVVRGGPKSDT